MSVREFPSEDSATRQERAENCEILDIREIDGEQFGANVTVFEIDAINERGEHRENVTIVPEMLFENTKDVQYRHEAGIVGKYTRAICQESDEARELLFDGIDAKRDETQSKIATLRQKDSRLLHTKADLGGI
jgi:hypothetical protein